jgi:ABC-type glutathione transport system ATPase component
MAPSLSEQQAEPAVPAAPAPLVVVENLVKDYPIGEGRRKRSFRAVDDVSFEIPAGTTLGVVGESGSGKSTTAMITAGLTRRTSGSVRIDGREVGDLDAAGLRALRRDVQVVFQDPHSSLDPRMSVAKVIDEPLYVHGRGDRKQRKERVAELLELVGLHPDYVDRHPHQLSGGQAQRVSIARALALEPRLLILDEPVSALDLSIQAQILNLLRRLQRDLGLSYLFIGHDLAAVAYVSDRVAVMHQGRIVEQGPVAQVYESPQEDYTRMLLAAILTPENDLGALNGATRFAGS